MSRIRELVFSTLNILVILALLAGILFGLGKIGIFVLPDYFGRLFGINNDVVSVLPSDDGKIYKSLSKGVSDDKITVVADISAQNVRTMLGGVKPRDNYYQEVTTTTIDSGKSVSEKATVRRSDGRYYIKLYNSAGLLKKEIETNQDDTTAIRIVGNSGSIREIVVPSGAFDIDGESGVISSHDRFLESQSQVDDSSYSVAYGSFGTVMQVIFTTKLDSYTQTEKYWLSLDYGIVTRAECYEGDELVFKQETTVLNSNPG